MDVKNYSLEIVQKRMDILEKKIQKLQEENCNLKEQNGKMRDVLMLTYSNLSNDMRYLFPEQFS